MQIKRDYSQPFFSDRRRRRGIWRWLLLYVLIIAGFLFFVDSNFSTLQLMALDAIGQAPPPTPFASDLATEGVDKFAMGDLDGARDLLRRAIMQQPQNVDYLYQYGRVLIEMGVDNTSLYPEAIQIGEQAIQANPNDPRGYAIKSRAMDLNGDSANAVPVGQAGLQIDRNFAPLHTALSAAYLSIDRYDVSLSEAETAIELDPNDAAAHRVYALALVWLGRNDEALDQFEQAVGLNPNLAPPYFELASMYRRLANLNPNASIEYYELAVATYERVLAMQPNNAKAYQRLCSTYIELGDHRRGQGYCEDALAINPDYTDALRDLGRAQYTQRNYEGSIESFERCVQLQESLPRADQDIECFYIRGLAHYYLGDCQEAWDILSDSINRRHLLTDDPEDTVLSNTVHGLELITQNCTGFGGRALPTAIPPTAIPPTPIGG
ncbi:MAG: tetratricopeptide repeat protein [Anaerolineae bacterium]|nr:tetratricopeptide repeat protein [Anaerolineae bacterium]